MFRATRSLLAAATKPPVLTTPTARTKVTTGIAGIDVHPQPLSALHKAYNSTLKMLESMPPAAVYRQSAEAITRERLAVVQRAHEQATEADIEAVEREIDAGLVEELVIQAEEELKLAGKMLEYKPSVREPPLPCLCAPGPAPRSDHPVFPTCRWEDLAEAPPAGQWAPFRVTPSTTTADDLHPN